MTENHRLVAPVDTTTIAHAKQWLREHFGEGAICPVCDQTVRLYRRTITKSMAAALLACYRHYGQDFGDITTVWNKYHNADAPKLRYWGLLQCARDVDPDARTGVWRVTDLGAAWISGDVTVQSHALVYNSKCFGLEGDPLTFIAALNDKAFSLAELLAERPWPPPSDPEPTLF